MSTRTPTSLWRLVVVEATSGVPLVAGAVGVLAALLSGTAITDPTLLPGWGDPLNAVLSTCFVLSSFAAGAAASHAGWLRRSGLAELAVTAPDGRWRTQGIAAAASGIWAMTAYACLMVMVLLTSDLDGPFSPSMLLLPVQGAALVIAGTAVGTLAGTAIPSTWMPPLTATLVFVVLNVVDRADGALDRYSMTFSFIFYQNNLAPNATLLLATITLAVGISIAACAALRAMSNWPRSLAWVALTVVLLASGIAATRLAPAGDVEYRTSGSAACAEQSAVRLCVFSESAPQLRPMAAALAQARQAALPVFGAVPRDFREPLVPSVLDDPAPADIPPNSERFGYLGRAVEAVVPVGNCSPLITERQDLMSLVYERLQANSVDSEKVRGVARLSLSEQIAWARPRLDRVRECQ